MTMTAPTMPRRSLLALGALTAAALAGAPARAQPVDMEDGPDPADSLVTEQQSGDARLASESLTFNPVALLRDVQGASKAAFEPRISDFAPTLLTTLGTDFVGKSRAQNRGEITAYLGLFDLPFSTPQGPVPFCAAGLSYASASVYAKAKGVTVSRSSLRSLLGDIDHHHFYPTPSVIDMMYVAMGKRRWVRRQDATGNLAARPGWIVVFNWNQDGKPDHVGIVERVAGANLHTIEFNTSDTDNSNGGTVARRTRPLNAQVQGFIRPEVVRAV
ncbi:CHAP domain-containing protein [Phenylobacterium sp.]|uniref:CHAP domain-containing protein n=1 Tax=Phenylobacterium sp. TaxID=1871053 RepID=UPI00272FAC1A|nr:CHAP domain-containing protein [Phenylobacterium sp.]MDP1617029.1 CHAP domain-containing protein [Phenylobacterium sp.]MDP1987000.1 CHAP domain-containing protein [Phenylobacterium sp.]